MIRWYNSSSLKSALAAPDLGRSMVVAWSLSAFEKDSGTKLWTKAKTTVNTTLYPDAPSPGYRDLQLDADGQTIWAACACDAVDGTAKALVKLSTQGTHDAFWRAAADPPRGLSVVEANGALYLGAEAATTWPSSPKQTARSPG